MFSFISLETNNSQTDINKFILIKTVILQIRMHFISAAAGHPGPSERVLEGDPPEREAGEGAETASCRCWSSAAGNEKFKCTMPAWEWWTAEDGAAASWAKGKALIKLMRKIMWWLLTGWMWRHLTLFYLYEANKATFTLQDTLFSCDFSVTLDGMSWLLLDSNVDLKHVHIHMSRPAPSGLIWCICWGPEGGRKTPRYNCFSSSCRQKCCLYSNLPVLV